MFRTLSQHPYLRTLFHVFLLFVTLLTTTLAGGEWAYNKYFYWGDYSWSDFMSGFGYSIPFLLILTAHEFGHYFAAAAHRVRATLPYYIPIYVPYVPFLLGTMGAIIRLKDLPRTNTQLFDIGIAGPLAGFVFIVFFFIYGFTHLPPLTYLFSIHPEYAAYGVDYADYVYAPGFMEQSAIQVVIGKNLFFYFFQFLADSPALVPNQYELMHYPMLFAGYLSLVFTSINLLPIGQLDGGHILYGLVGYRWHKKIATIFFIGFLFYAGLGYVTPYHPLEDLVYEIPLTMFFYFLIVSALRWQLSENIALAVGIFSLQFLVSFFFPLVEGYSGWLLFIFILSRFIGIDHPRAEKEVPIGFFRKMLGCLALLVFIVSFSPAPIRIIANPTPTPTVKPSIQAKADGLPSTDAHGIHIWK